MKCLLAIRTVHLLQFPLCQRSVKTGSATSSSCTGTERVLHTLQVKVKTGPYVCIIPQGYQQIAIIFCLVSWYNYFVYDTARYQCYLFSAFFIDRQFNSEARCKSDSCGGRSDGSLPGYSQQERLTLHALHPLSNTAVQFA